MGEERKSIWPGLYIPLDPASLKLIEVPYLAIAFGRHPVDERLGYFYARKEPLPELKPRHGPTEALNLYSDPSQMKIDSYTITKEGALKNIQTAAEGVAKTARGTQEIIEGAKMIKSGITGLLSGDKKKD